jgi:hypothetical protein
MNAKPATNIRLFFDLPSPWFPHKRSTERRVAQQAQVGAPVMGNRACTTETYSIRKEVDIKA